jgi:hypothetical protein
MDEILPDFLKNKAKNTADFKLPDGYFETFSARIFEKLSASETVFLDEIEAHKSVEFKMPTDYFENLPNQVFEKIGLENRSEKEETPENFGKIVELPSKKSFFKIIRRPAIIAAAASGALIIAFGLFFREKIVEKPSLLACNTACLSEKISESDVQFYLSENLVDFSSDELLNEDLVGDLEAKSVKKSHEMDIQAEDADPVLREILDDLNEEDLEKML